MKILHVIPGLEVSGGGGNRAPAELCASLAALGHDVTLVHVTGRRGEPCFEPKAVRVVGFPSRFFHRYAYSPALCRFLKTEIPQSDIVHIHALWQYPNLAAATVARQHGVPYIVQPHGSLNPWRLNHKPIRKWWYGRFVERSLLEASAFIHVESELDQHDVQTYLPNARTVVNPCGAFAESFVTPAADGYLVRRWPQLRDKRVLLFLARIDVMKGLDILIDAFADCFAGRRDIALLVIGPDSAGMVASLRHRSEELGIASQVVWGGEIFSDERFEIMRQCDAYILPSKSDNFGISVLEAMFCGAPILTTSATPWTELVHHNAGLVVDPHVADVSRGLRQLVDMPHEQRRQLGLCARRLAHQKYLWRSIAADLVRHYELVSSDRPIKAA